MACSTEKKIAISKKFKVPLSIQWHITTLCNNRCRHCYMFDKSFKKEQENILPLKKLLKILDSLEDFEKKYNANFALLALSGGDPLLRKDSFELFSELKRRNKKFSIMGNPETLNKKNLSKLKKLGLKNFQMSLDGLEKTHDFFRSKGSFKRTIQKIDLLKEYDIYCNIMFTLFPQNKGELIPLMRFLATKTKAHSFSFNIGCSVGNGKKLEKTFTPKQLKTVFSEFAVEKKRLKEEGFLLNIAELSNFHKLISFENNLLYPITSNSFHSISGCSIGWGSFAILSDGSTLTCRRLPLKIGKMPDQSFEKIFLGNTLLKKFRRKIFFKECGSCDFYTICRGCPAYSYGITKDPFSKHPLCFRKDISKKTKKQNNIKKSPPLNSTYEEEWEYIKSYYTFYYKINDFIKEKEFRHIYLDLYQDPNELKKFLKNPYAYLLKKDLKLTKDQIASLVYNFYENIEDKKNVKLEDLKDPIAKKAFNLILEDCF